MPDISIFSMTVVILYIKYKVSACSTEQKKCDKCGKTSPFLHQDSFAFSLHKELVHPVLLRFKMLFVERLKQGNTGNGKMTPMPR